MSFRLLHGDALAMLKTLPSESVHCCVTSPPYFGLRDYGVDGQIGLEPTPQAYIAKLMEVFAEVWRVLRPDGTLWTNLGDSYSGGGRSNYDAKSDNKGNGASRGLGRPCIDGLKPKDLIGIPWRFAFAMRDARHYGPIRSESDRAWLAALIDGEGSIGVKRDQGRSNGGEIGSCQPGHIPFISICNQDRELLDRCVEITSYGSVRVKATAGVDSRGMRSRRDTYGWWVSSRQAVAIIRDVFPYLIAKRRQAMIAYTLDVSNREGRAMRGKGPLPQSEQDKRAFLKALCHDCNQRRSVDMPSWIQQPPSNTYPGWYLRSDIIWAKPNPMPESVTDRPTKSHEYIFLLAKNEKYHYDTEAIKEESITGDPRRPYTSEGAWQMDGRPDEQKKSGQKRAEADFTKRNKRTVWTVATSPYSEAHFAVFPPDLIEPCILAGTSEHGCCARCGAPWQRLMERTDEIDTTAKGSTFDGGKTGARDGGERTQPGPRYRKAHAGWEPTCKCDAPVIPCTVLDPFAGAGTTGLVATRYQRDFIGIELNAEYVDLANARIYQDAPLFNASADLPEGM